VIFNIADSFVRREEGQERVIGTLLGSVGEGYVEIKNSYTVPHNESGGQVAVDIEFHRTLLDLQSRVAPNEVIVGWYSTGTGLTPSDALIHEFYSRECSNPVLLTLDTSLLNPDRTLRAWVGNSLSLSSIAGTTPSIGTHFSQIETDLKFAEAERVGLQVLKQPHVNHLPTEIEGLQQTLARLKEMLGAVGKYVESVVRGESKPNQAIGRFLAEAVAAVPRLDPETFEKCFNESIHDVLLVVYLSNLTRTQLALAQNLQTYTLPSPP